MGGGCVLLLGVGGPREAPKEREGWGQETWGLKVSGGPESPVQLACSTDDTKR